MSISKDIILNVFGIEEKHTKTRSNVFTMRFEEMPFEYNIGIFLNQRLYNEMILMEKCSRVDMSKNLDIDFCISLTEIIKKFKITNVNRVLNVTRYDLRKLFNSENHYYTGNYKKSSQYDIIILDFITDIENVLNIFPQNTSVHCVIRTSVPINKTVCKIIEFLLQFYINISILKPETDFELNTYIFIVMSFQRKSKRQYKKNFISDKLRTFLYDVNNKFMLLRNYHLRRYKLYQKNNYGNEFMYNQLKYNQLKLQKEDNFQYPTTPTKINTISSKIIAENDLPESPTYEVYSPNEEFIF